MPYRIYFVGSHSTGKTSLARYVSEQYKVKLLPEVARQVLAEMELPFKQMRTDMAAVIKYQEQVFLRQLEVEEQNKTHHFVSDRAFDFMAYTAEHTPGGVASRFFNSSKFRRYMKSLTSMDAIIFFIRPDKSIMANDGIREQVDWDGVVRIDGMIKFMLQVFQVGYVSLWHHSMQERVETVNSVLDFFTLDRKASR